MSTSPAITYDAPIIAADGNQVVAVESSISFQWQPATGNSYHDQRTWLNWDNGTWMSSDTTGPSNATGTVTFDGVTSSEPFQSLPTQVSFRFNTGLSVTLPSIYLPNGYSPAWTYDPATGILDPRSTNASWDDYIDYIGVGFDANRADLVLSHWDGNSNDFETGHWQLVPQIHNVDVFGGVGNDTILGGQGEENLYGGVGNDLIRAGTGNDLVRGGTGNNQIYGGTGQQTLMGGSGDDTIWGGSGAQLLIGGNGQDMIHAGSGQQTLIGGGGGATLWGGSGAQVLEGGNGNNVLNAGAGNETLSGGTGKDTFVFSSLSGHAVITDFQPHQDIIKIAFGPAGPALVHPSNLTPDISADANGDAVMAVGSTFRLVLRHVPAQQVQADPGSFFYLG